MSLDKDRVLIGIDLDFFGINGLTAHIINRNGQFVICLSLKVDVERAGGGVGVAT